VTRPRALIFDLDDTLLDWSGMGAAAARTADLIAAMRPGVDGARLAAANAAIWAAYWPEIESDWMLGRRESPAIQREAWRRSLLACGVDDAELTDLAREVFAREERASHRLYDDAVGLLDGLGRTYALALITNGARESQREKLQTVGIAHHFGAVVISAEVGFAKPDRRIFQHALDRLGVSAHEAWHIGDSLANDVAGALAIGVRAIWLNRHGTVRPAAAPEPDVEICGLGELLDQLA
jgi:putative hydrolase of the HAD superfamily